MHRRAVTSCCSQSFEPIPITSGLIRVAYIEHPIDVSVIIPVFNDETGLPVAVKSALNQAGVSLEIIVIDDASKIAMQPVVA